MNPSARSISRTCTSALVRRFFLGGLVVTGLGGQLAQPTHGGLFTLVDDNSIAQFNTGSQSNAYSWVVDGTDQLAQQAFWYRVGNSAEQSLHLLPIAGEGATDTNFDSDVDNLFVRYLSAGLFKVEVNYRLDGGAPGSFDSDITEQISITNLSGSSLDFHFFQYSDFDLNGTAGNDGVIFTNPNAVRQFDGVLAMTETVITPIPNHREADFFANTLGKLNDGVATTLNDAPPYGFPLGPGDMTWAYQWDVVIPAGGSFQISKDKQITGVPEPSSFALAGLAGIAICVLKRRRQLA